MIVFMAVLVAVALFGRVWKGFLWPLQKMLGNPATFGDDFNRSIVTAGFLRVGISQSTGCMFFGLIARVVRDVAVLVAISAHHESR
jgi:hypothetical protein